MDKKSDNNLIKIYNRGVREQEKAFGGNKGLCPYFKIDTNTLKKLTADEIRIWESTRIDPDKFVFNKLWSEIFEKNRRKYKENLKEKELKLLNKKIKFNPTPLSERINVKNIRITENLNSGRNQESRKQGQPVARTSQRVHFS